MPQYCRVATVFQTTGGVRTVGDAAAAEPAQTSTRRSSSGAV
jgi:hypothetical protein